MEVYCDNCGALITKNPAKVHKFNYCCVECMGEHRKHLYIGENNPNKKYEIPQNLFETIDTEFKAWLLGWIASDGCIRQDKITISVHPKDKEVLEIIRNNIDLNLPIKSVNKGKLLSLNLYGTKLVQSCLDALNLTTGTDKCRFLTNAKLPQHLFPHFIRGVFEGDGHVHLKSSPAANITSNSLEFLEYIKNIVQIPGNIYKDCHDSYKLEYGGVNALDFLGRLYEHSTYRLKRKYEVYLDICEWSPILKGKGNTTRLDSIYVAKTREDAIFPSKTNVSDSGYDLTVVDIYKQFGQVTLYETGIRVTPPMGYYFQLVPRSSISKTGYMLANSIGIIDRSYTGSIKIALIKVDKDAPDLQLPCRIAQIIPTPIQHIQVEEVDNLEETSRGAGGFGSTGTK